MRVRVQTLFARTAHICRHMSLVLCLLGPSPLTRLCPSGLCSRSQRLVQVSDLGGSLRTMYGPQT